MRPRVSIGLFVYNGERYLREAIDSILAQTFADFELIISDNASTDKTKEICEEYVARDPRVRYSRNETNLGAAGNMNRAFALATGEYFKWAAHDDIFDKRFLEKSVETLDRDPSIVLSATGAKIIDESMNVISESAPLHDAESEFAHRRFRALIPPNWHCLEIVGGLMRSDAVRKAPPVAGCAYADGLFLVRMGLLGRFCYIPERLVFYREHSGSMHRVVRTFREQVVFYDPRKAGKITFPQWRRGLEYAKSISLIRLPLREQLLCYVHLAGWVRRTTLPLLGNVVFASIQVFHRVASVAIGGARRVESRMKGKTSPG